MLTVLDAAAFGGSQTQTFSYDALNRLLTAQAAGGSHGVYTVRSYSYNNAGNITSFESAALGYNDAAHKDAVTHVAGAQRYWYDQNSNATRRINGSQHHHQLERCAPDGAALLCLSCPQHPPQRPALSLATCLPPPPVPPESSPRPARRRSRTG